MGLITWLVLAGVYLLMLVFLGLTALNKGHTVLFFCGLLVPLLWIPGALLPPTSAASASRARANLH